MRFRYLFIGQWVLQYLRSNYSVRNEPDSKGGILTYIYKYCLCCCYSLYQNLQEYYRYRYKMVMYGGCTPNYSQITNVLNYWYSQYHGDINIGRSSASFNLNYMYYDNKIKYYLWWDATNVIFWGYGGNYTQEPILNIPQSLYDDKPIYEQLISDLNTLIPFYITYSVNIINQ